jgi:ketol-acid reductoisomerase
MQAKRWLDSDVSMDALKNQTIAVIGYGIQGRAQASNMRDSGLNVLVGLRKGGNSWALAEEEGHQVREIDDATKQADIIHILFLRSSRQSTENMSLSI